MVVPLVIDIDFTGELERGSILESVQVMQRIEFEDVGVDGVLGILARALVTGSDHNTGDLCVLGAKVGKCHR